jgi:hypothetical protein
VPTGPLRHFHDEISGHAWPIRSMCRIGDELHCDSTKSVRTGEAFFVNLLPVENRNCSCRNVRRNSQNSTAAMRGISGALVRRAWIAASGQSAPSRAASRARHELPKLLAEDTLETGAQRSALFRVQVNGAVRA